MKKININTEYKVMKELASHFNINYVGVKKEKLVELINSKIDETQTQTKNVKGKWYEQENAFPYEVGEVLVINTNHKYEGIHNRLLEVSGPSTKKNALKGFLINPINGEKQKTNISVDFINVSRLNEVYNIAQ